MNVKKIVLGIGIFIVYLLVLNYGIEAFYASPQYQDYCSGAEHIGKYSLRYDVPDSVFNCNFSRQLQEQANTCYAEQGIPIYEYNDAGCTTSLKECNFCDKKYNEANLAHSKIVFAIALIAGIITLLVGFTVLSVEPVGSALMASGVGAIFYGSVRNWENLGNIWRFLLLLVAFILLIWIALRLNKRDSRRRS
ncbi:MAG: hypothetical protein AABW65_00305 [Nanoarchaeota archaeon]